MTMCLHTLFSAWGPPSPDAPAIQWQAAIGFNINSSDRNAPMPKPGQLAVSLAMDPANAARHPASKRCPMIGFSRMGEPD
ncbi:hypothetical protein [Pseudophaeobacter profundi]|uniref:hypothetical protein n=1 Tax=Pseudophaeobacter profundi TaxID=3034152 RepID=UPI00242F7E89|nr:hypothetical protein [Pseudophaeobacter profundi]